MNLIFKFSADATAADRAVALFAKRAGGYVGSIGSELKSQLVGAFAAGAVISAVRSFGAHVVETVDNIKDMSEQLGVSTDEIQRMQKAANDAGVKFTAISTALQRIEALRSQAATGDKAASNLFSGLGIDPTQGNALEILKQAVEASTRGARENALLFDLLGKKAGILRNIVEELKAQGKIELISEDQIKSIDKANARLEEAQRRLTVAGAPIVAAGIEDTAATLSRISSLKGFLASALAPMASSFAGRLFPNLFGGTASQASTGSAAASGLGGTQSSLISAATPAASAISLGQPGDSLSRIGLFVGGRPEIRSLASIERNTADTARSSGQQTRILKSIEDLLKISADQI